MAANAYGGRPLQQSRARRIIIALILAFGLIIGMGFDQFAPVLAVIAAL